MFCNLEKQLKIALSNQPTIKNNLILLCINNDQTLLIAPFDASTVLVFGAEESPLAQPRNLIMGNLLGAISAVFSFGFFGNNSFSCGIAVAIAIAFGQLFRCLHPPAGAVALLGVISNANLNFILSPVLIGSLIFVMWGIIFNRISKKKSIFPLH